jgi:hypothetical protein
MEKSRTGRKATPGRKTTPPQTWEKWTTELPRTTIVLLKVRAAQEQRHIRETLRDAIETYLQTAVQA